MAQRKDPLAAEIGERMEQAWRAAGFASQGEFIRATGIADRLLRRYIAGDVMPGVRACLSIADVCHVSLDWLIRGEESTPPAFAEWLQTPQGRAVDDEARVYLASLPTRGYRPSVHFYDLAFLAWQAGLAPEEAAAGARGADHH